jgi:hypothetical protein
MTMGIAIVRVLVVPFAASVKVYGFRFSRRVLQWQSSLIDFSHVISGCMAARASEVKHKKQAEQGDRST